VSIFTWAVENWSLICDLYLALVGLVSVLIKLFPWVEEDSVLKPILKFMGKYIALNVSKKDAGSK
jgi:hypothetical protein